MRSLGVAAPRLSLNISSFGKQSSAAYWRFCCQDSGLLLRVTSDLWVYETGSGVRRGACRTGRPQGAPRPPSLLLCDKTKTWQQSSCRVTGCVIETRPNVK